MAEQQKLDIHGHYGGADTDSNPEYVNTKKGKYYNAYNLRYSTVSGNSLALKKIGGETKAFGLGNFNILPSGAIAMDYHKCMLACEINNYIVAFWAPLTSTYPSETRSFITIDNDIVCLTSSAINGSDDLNFNENYFFQYDVDESCTGGRLFATDNYNPPLIFNIQDMVDNFDAGNTKYYDDFNLSLFRLSLNKQLDVPVFDSFVSKGLNGLACGNYIYSIRYVDDLGNRTQWSPATPLIPVPANFSSDSTLYPYSKTYGGSLSGDTPMKSPYGIKIKFRITNINNYSYIEIRRVYWSGNVGLGFTPTAYTYQYTRNLLAGEISYAEFTDDDTIDWVEAVEEEETQVVAFVDKCKSIRYYGNRLVLGNISYPSKDIEDNSSIVFNTSSLGNTGYAFMHRMGNAGHSDPYNSTYHKSYMSRERYGFGLLVRDENGEKSLVMPITNMTNYLVPGRRDEITTDSLSVGKSKHLGNPIYPSISDTAIDQVSDVYEIFDFRNLTTGIREHEAGWSGTIKTDTSLKTIRDTDYSPLSPTNYEDGYDDHDYRINTRATTEVNATFGSKTQVDYNPEHFAPNYYSKGVAIQGISGLPSWASSVSILRTAPAKRVIAQGLAMYRLYNDSGQSNPTVLNAEPCKKSLNKIWLFSDDLEQYVDLDFGTEFSNLKIELVAPLGYFSECYNGNRQVTKGWKQVDSIVYARMCYNNSGSSTSPDLLYRTGETTYGTRFGKWRNSAAQANATGHATFGISAVTRKRYEGVGRDYYYEITLDSDIYAVQSAFSGNGRRDVNNNDVQAWQEPFYIVNIINENAEVTDNNVNEYVDTGCNVKLNAIIGKITESTLRFDLYDERWEDCIPSQYVDGVSSPNSSDNLFVYIEDKDQNIERRWINVTNKGTTTINSILTDITNNGYYNASLGGGLGIVRVYGVYWHEWGSDNKSFTIKFEQPALYSTFARELFIPTTNSYVRVKYDNRFPIKVFGGDTFIGESIFSPIDGQNNYSADVSSTSVFQSFVGFPYPFYGFNLNYYVMLNGNTGKEENSYYNPGQDLIRQLAVMFTSESRIATPFTYNIKSTGSEYDSGISINRSFPMIHYVMRPCEWNTTLDSNFSGGSDIDPQYISDYPGECQYWGYGGFWTNPLFNLDYSSWNSYDYGYDRPDVGFTEETDFCTQVIWSKEESVGVQDVPNLKTFPSANIYNLEDKTGEIKYLFDTESSKGNNLYAFTNNGVAILLTNKFELRDAGGDALGFVNKSDQFITDEYWLQKQVGMNDEMWRSAAEFDKIMFWANAKSVYSLFDNKVEDIGKNDYYNNLYNNGIVNIKDGVDTRVSSVVDMKHEEYWLSLYEDGVIDKTFVYDIKREVWVGEFDYNYQQYVSKKYGVDSSGDNSDGQTYGVGNDNINRNTIYLLDDDEYYYNSALLEAKLVGISNQEQPFEKEFIAFKTMTNNKPTRINFAESISGLPECSLYEGMSTPVNTYYLKDYGGWTNKIPRKTAGDRDRLQSRYLAYEIIHDENEDFILIDTIINYKTLKLQI